jgi:arginine/lysine/ornithine decarboxylase
MRYKSLLITPNESLLKEEITELEKRGMDIVGVTTFNEACRQLLADGTIQVVLSEWSLPVDKKSKETIVGLDVFRHFLRLRFEVSLFLYTDVSDCRSLTTGGILNGYFFKDEKDFDDISRKVKAEVGNKNRAPFYEALVEYSKHVKDSWHTPGHSSGDSVKNSPWVSDFYEFFGKNIFTSDVSVSVPALDSLLHPTGVIKHAQELAARAFGSRYTFFSTNGTSTSNKVLIQTLLKPGDAILLDRNCHKSVHYGVIVAGAIPIYMLPSVNSKYGIFGPVPKKRILEEMDKAISTGKRLKAIILTNCTYDGLIYDIEDIVKEAHNRGIKVIVDEAWFGYAIFHPDFYPSAMRAGADYSTQSTHKTMSCFSQASMIHVNDPDFEQKHDFFMENYSMLASTSPQYPMIASLDVATKQMVMEGYSLLQRNLELAENLKKSINSLEKFRVLELEDLISDEIKYDKVRLDHTKLTIDVSNSGYTSKEIEHLLLSRHNIQIEKSTFNTITVLITIGSTYSKLNRLYLALENIETTGGNKKHSDSEKVLKDFELTLSRIKYRPRFAFYCDGMSVPLKDSVGCVATVMVTPYPPGIPLLVPGQIITQEIVNALSMYRDYGVEIHGLYDNLIKVATHEEEQQLEKQGYLIQE